MRTKAPAFQFYPSDWLSAESVTTLSLEQEGAYIRLLSYCWIEGSIPSDPEKIAVIIGKNATADLVRVLIPLFQIDKKNSQRLTHSRLEKERKKQKVWRKKSSEGGKKSAKKRWGTKANETHKTDKGGYAVVTECLPPNDNSSSPSSSPPSGIKSTHIARVKFAIPASEQEAVEWAARAGVLPDFAKALYHQCEGRGWVDGAGNDIQMWSSYARGRFLKEQFSTPLSSQTKSKAPTVFELKTVIQTKEDRARQLKNDFCGEGLSGWHSEPKRQEYLTLRKEIKELNDKLSNSLQ